MTQVLQRLSDEEFESSLADLEEVLAATPKHRRELDFFDDPDFDLAPVDLAPAAPAAFHVAPVHVAPVPAAAIPVEPPPAPAPPPAASLPERIEAPVIRVPTFRSLLAEEEAEAGQQPVVRRRVGAPQFVEFNIGDPFGRTLCRSTS